MCRFLVNYLMCAFSSISVSTFFHIELVQSATKIMASTAAGTERRECRGVAEDHG